MWVLYLNQADLKIIDFGLSRFEDGSEAMTTRVGTPYYIAPEGWYSILDLIRPGNHQAGILSHQPESQENLPQIRYTYVRRRCFTRAGGDFPVFLHACAYRSRIGWVILPFFCEMYAVICLYIQRSRSAVGTLITAFIAPAHAMG